MQNERTVDVNEKDIKVPNLAWGIFFTSVLSLYLEVLFIRFLGTEIRIFAYLQNTILIVCFLGLGLGMFTSSKPFKLKHSLLPLSIVLCLLALPITQSTMGSISEMLSVLGDNVIWFYRITNDPVARSASVLIGLVLTYILLALVVDIFVPFGRILGKLMDLHPKPIWAYSINILGSLFGTWAFVFLSYFFLPPFAWILVAGCILLLFIIWGKEDKKQNLILLIVILLASWFASQTANSDETIWSPYQKLSIRQSQGFEVGEKIVTVNNVGYQGLIDLSRSNVETHPEKFPPEMEGLSQYDIPGLLHPNPKSILIVGAGTGNDVAGALRNNIPAVTAVEIDPVIIEIGKSLHPEDPYSSSNVHVVIDDARSFFANTDEKYDVISFGLLDSHTTTSMTNARLDHYVYTVESLTQARSRLNEDGIIVLSFEAQKPYIAERIHLALKEVFNQEPLVFKIPYTSYGWGGTMFVAGNLEGVYQQLEKNKRLAGFIEGLQMKHPIVFENNTKITTDDWPYIYLENPKIPNLYLLLFLVILLLLLRSTKKWEAKIKFIIQKSGFWHFFFLGAAFLLLEVQNISKASVALGNTWQVNAVIITGILIMALLANWIAYKFPKLPLLPVYFLLIGTCLGLYFVDLARFAFLPYTLRAVILGGLTSLPMLFSGIVFIRSFAWTTDKSSALGANLIGALTGALLQSITFITGIKALLLIVAALYLLAILTMPNVQNEKSLV
jgi:spermidine synthase